MGLLRIIPPLITLYPGDRQTFTALGARPTGMWTSLTNGTVTTNYTIDLTNSATFGQGYLAYRPKSGITELAWTLNGDCTPSNSSGQFNIIAESVATGALVNVEINYASIRILKDNGIGQSVVYNAAYTPVNGDVFFIRFFNGAGDTFVSLRSGAVTQATSITQLLYPLRIRANLTPPVTGSDPQVPALRITGDWSMDEPTWSLTGNGSSAAGGTNQRIYLGGTVGISTLRAVFEDTYDGGFQEATAIISCPPLSIIGDIAITLDPAEEVTFSTTYDNAQSALVAWSIVSGSGSFSGKKFTAPATAGTTVVRATSGSQTADITVTTDTVLTSTYTAAQPGEVLTLTTNMTGTVTWTAESGSISGSPGTTVTWTAPNTPGVTPRITATNGTLTRIVQIPVLRLFPYYPTTPVSWANKKDVLISKAEDGSRSTRIKRDAYEAFEFKFNNRSVAEAEAARAFVNLHYPGLRCIVTDALRSVRKVGYFDSDLNLEANGACQFSYSFRFQEG